MKNIVLADCDAQSVLILVSQYLGRLKGSKKKLDYSSVTIAKWQRIYDSIGTQIEQQGGIGYDGDI